LHGTSTDTSLIQMIVLQRRRETVKMATDVWEALQALAREEGWRPIGVLSEGSAARHTTYMPGRSVMARGAHGLAAALERFVNGERADKVKFDLAPIVQLVNFLRGGAFDIR